MDNAKFVNVRGTNTRYFEAGSGEPLVLIHGGSFGYFENAEDWDRNFDVLADQFHVFAIDKIGCGFTDNPPTVDDYYIGATVDHAYAFIQTMGLGPVHVAGHSRGGYTATRVALEHPEVVRTLIIVDSSTLMTPSNPQYGVWEAEAAKIADVRERYRYLEAVNSYSDEHLDDHHMDVILEIVSLPKTIEALRIMEGGQVVEHNRELVERQQETHAWIREGRLRCPTLLVWAFNDPSATMDRCGIPAMKLILPNVAESSMHIVNRAGHYAFREQPEEFNRVVTEFITRHAAARQPQGVPA
jgi:2-hydroxy-6-oxonona-2,4-dienedioate hydrolase